MLAAEGVDVAAVGMLAAVDVDAAALTAAVRAGLERMLAEALANVTAGLAAADIVSYTLVLGLRPCRHQRPDELRLRRSGRDHAPDHGEWWASNVPAARLWRVPLAVHLVIHQAWPLVFEALH